MESKNQTGGRKMKTTRNELFEIFANLAVVIVLITAVAVS